MKASNYNLNTLMISIHSKIEEYSDFLATRIDEGNPIEHVAYPPNNGFTENEVQSLKALQNRPELKSALRKLIADSAAGVLFDLFNYIDGTGDPDPEIGKWTELALVDRDESIEPTDYMLHNQLFESYRNWKEIRPNSNWNLDNYHE